MQQWYILRDPAMEDVLIEVATIRRFARIDLISDRIPDEFAADSHATGRGSNPGHDASRWQGARRSGQP